MSGFGCSLQCKFWASYRTNFCVGWGPCLTQCYREPHKCMSSDPVKWHFVRRRSQEGSSCCRNVSSAIINNSALLSQPTYRARCVYLCLQPCFRVTSHVKLIMNKWLNYVVCDVLGLFPSTSSHSPMLGLGSRREDPKLVIRLKSYFLSSRTCMTTIDQRYRRTDGRTDRQLVVMAMPHFALHVNGKTIVMLCCY